VAGAPSAAAPRVPAGTTDGELGPGGTTGATGGAACVPGTTPAGRVAGGTDGTGGDATPEAVVGVAPDPTPPASGAAAAAAGLPLLGLLLGLLLVPAGAGANISTLDPTPELPAAPSARLRETDHDAVIPAPASRARPRSGTTRRRTGPCCAASGSVAAQPGHQRRTGRGPTAG